MLKGSLFRKYEWEHTILKIFYYYATLNDPYAVLTQCHPALAIWGLFRFFLQLLTEKR